MKLCRFGWHKWSKWIDLGTGKTYQQLSTGEKIGERPALFQESRCEKCNAAKRRVVRT